MRMLVSDAELGGENRIDWDSWPKSAEETEAAEWNSERLETGQPETRGPNEAGRAIGSWDQMDAGTSNNSKQARQTCAGPRDKTANT